MASQVQFAGQEITAAFLNSIAPLQAVRSSTQSKTSTTVLANDDTLFLALAANATYSVEMELYYSGGTQGSSDMQFAFTVPSGATGASHIARQNTGGTVSLGVQGDFVTATSCGTAGAGTGRSVKFSGTLVTSSAGTLHLQWAQNSSSGTATIMGLYSALKAWRLS